MNSLDNKKREQIVAALVEGNSIRATSRMTGVSQNTIFKLLADLGDACTAYQDEAFRNLNCKRIQCDESGALLERKQRTLRKNRKMKKAMAIFGRGLPLMPIRNLFLVGPSASVTDMRLTNSLLTWQDV